MSPGPWAIDPATTESALEDPSLDYISASKLNTSGTFFKPAKVVGNNQAKGLFDKGIGAHTLQTMFEWQTQLTTPLKHKQ